MTSRYVYNEMNRLMDISARLGGVRLAEFLYDLRPGGHRERLPERIGAAQIQGNPRITEWDYDNLYRLEEERITQGTDDATTTAGTVAYPDYDKVGNRQERAVTGDISTPLPPVISYGYDQNDRLTDLNGVQSYDHDESGNTIESGEIAGSPVVDTYDDRNRLIKRVEPNGRTIEILYDADGNRVRKTVSESGHPTVTTYFLVDTLNPTGYAQVLVEIRTVGTGDPTIKSYTYGLDRISQRDDAGALHYYGYDGLGSVRYLTNELGGITDRYYYDAFGVLLLAEPMGGITSLTENVYLYAGEQWDNDLDLYYNRARYMDPTIGRFWTMDEFEGVNRTPQSLHKYLYAHADPVNGKDPSGYLNITQIGVAIGIVATLATVTAVIVHKKNLSKATGGGIVSAGGDIGVIQAELGKLPSEIMAELRAGGVTFVAVRYSVVEYRPDLQGKTPRGHPPGTTWDTTPGAYDPLSNTVIIATSRSFISGSFNLTLHETGHAYDRVKGRLSSRRAFVEAWRRDQGSLNQYEGQPGEAGFQEAFAEGFARFYGGDSSYKVNHPNWYQYWEERE